MSYPRAAAVTFPTTTALLNAYPSGAVLPKSVVTLGRTVVGDGGGAAFYPKAGGVENGGTIRVDIAGMSWYAITAGQIPSVALFGTKGDGTTDDTAQFQKALNYGGEFVVPNGTYKLTQINVVQANTALFLSASALLSFATQGASTRAISQQANNFEIHGGAIRGPASGVYVTDEQGIEAIGASTGSRLSGLVVDGTEIYNFGSRGIYGKFLDNIEITATTQLHNCGYAGAMFASCNNGKFESRNVHDIGPGTSGNMYGVSFTLDTTGYNLDPNAGTPLAVNPFCQSWTVDAAICKNIAWTAIDAHGAYNISVTGCTTYNCKGGIEIAGPGGDATGYAGWQNRIHANIIDARHADGTAGDYMNSLQGIVVSGGIPVVVPAQRVFITDNYLYGYGFPNGTGTPAIQASSTNGVVISRNIIENWGGVGIGIDDSEGAIVTNNQAYGLANSSDTSGLFILNNTVSAVSQAIEGNVITPSGIYTAKTGFKTKSTIRPLLVGNDFSPATGFAVEFNSTSFFSGTDGAPLDIIDLGAGGGTATLDLSALAYGSPLVWCSLTAAAPITITNITGIQVGAKVILSVQIGSSNITFDRSNAALAGGANWIGTPYGTLHLLHYAASGVQWIELSRSANS